MSAWLACIALDLVTMGNYYDVAVRDIVMGIGAFSLAELTAARTRAESPMRAIGSHAHAAT